MSKLSRHQTNKKTLLSSYTDMYGDVVLRHRARIAEKALRVEAERKDQAKSQFIANMSHELRTPLNAIIGFSQIMKENETLNLTSEKIVEYSGYINDTAEHLLNIINDLLDMSKIQSGRQELCINEVDPEELIRGCLTLVKGAADDKGVALINDIPAEFPCFEGDALRLKQVFANILSNAIKWTPEGGTVRITANTADDYYAMFDIIDTGRGMTAEEIETAKTPFCQVEADLDRRVDGTGLGIPIAAGFVELHNGSFDIFSKKGAGTTVRIILPLKQAEIREVYGAA